MTRDLNIVLAGFGGQGVLFAGKIIAQAGLMDERNISWLPSYGPEMRGGTCNCSVCLSDDPIGSPLVTEPNVLVAMNKPSADKFVPTVAPGGMVIVDATLVGDFVRRDDVSVFEVEATRLAEEHRFKTLANVILTGKLFAQTRFTSKEGIEAALASCIPAKKKDLLEPNLNALRLGMEL